MCADQASGDIGVIRHGKVQAGRRGTVYPRGPIHEEGGVVAQHMVQANKQLGLAGPLPAVARQLEGKTIRKVIVVPGRLVNVVG